MCLPSGLPMTVPKSLHEMPETGTQCTQLAKNGNVIEDIHSACCTNQACRDWLNVGLPSSDKTLCKHTYVMTVMITLC